MIVLDQSAQSPKLEGVGIRLNKKPPNATVKRTEKGGVNVTNTVALTKITKDEIRAVCHEYRLAVSSDPEFAPTYLIFFDSLVISTSRRT